MNAIRSFILSRIKDIAEQQNIDLAPLKDDLPLLDSGLNSLSIALLIALLTDELAYDPFDNGMTDMPVTIGDFIRMYERGA